MATGITAAAQIDQAITAYVAELRMTMEHDAMMANLIDTQRLPKKRGRTYTEPWVGAISSAALTDGIEFNSPTVINDYAFTITPGEQGVQVLWTHRMADSIDFNFAEVAGKMMGNAINYGIEQTLLALLDGFGGSLGSGTAPLTAGIISAAMAFVEPGIAASGATARTGARTTGDPLGGPYAVVAHPFNRHDLFGQLVGVGGTTQLTGAVVGNYPAAAGLTDPQMQILRGHYAGDVAGAGCFFTGNLPIASNVVKGAVFSKMALIYLKYREMIDKRVETDDGRATKHTMVIDIGAGERSDTGGIELNIDATAPAA